MPFKDAPIRLRGIATDEGIRVTGYPPRPLYVVCPHATAAPHIFAAITTTPSQPGGPVIGYVDGVATSYADPEEVAASANYRKAAAHHRSSDKQAGVFFAMMW